MKRIPITTPLSLLIMLVFVVKLAESSVSVHIVYTERPEDEELEAFHLRTLSKILGSHDAAKESLLYSYDTAGCGFSAKLSSDQVDRLSREPGILQVVPSQTHKLHSKFGNSMLSGPGKRY